MKFNSNMGSTRAAVLVFVFSLWCTLAKCCVRHGALCPEYTVLQKYEEYEERLYPSMVWISATEVGHSKSDVSVDLISRLYGYLGGDNDKGRNLDMMVPVRTTKIPLRGENSTYIMSVALTPDHQSDPPVPRNKMLTLQREPPTVYVTKSFGGMIREEEDWEDHADALRAATTNDEDVDTTYYYMAVYDSPWRQNDRLNEVWMFKQVEN